MTDALGKNPYRPGVGVRPLYLAGREGPLRRFDAMLRAAPEQHANMRVTGPRPPYAASSNPGIGSIGSSP